VRHEVELTPDQLRTRLKSLGFRRRGKDVESSLDDVQDAIIVSMSLIIAYSNAFQRLLQNFSI